MSDFCVPVQVDEHAIGRHAVNVWRADLVPTPPLPAYIKMVELIPLPWPMHRFWEALAYGWLQANAGALDGRVISFLNLGS